MFDFEKLDIYQVLRDLNNRIFTYLVEDERIDQYIKDQWRKASQGSVLNLVEGTCKMTNTDKKDLLIMVETARKARHRLANDQLSFPISTRDLIYWATMTVKLNDITKAFQHTVLNKADSDKRDLLSILNEAIRDSANTSEYRDGLETKLRTILDKINCSEQTRSILRADADKLLVALEKVEAIAYKRERMVEDITQEVNSNLKKARQDVKDIAQTLQTEALALATKEKETYERGKADAKAEIYKKLGIEV